MLKSDSVAEGPPRLPRSRGDSQAAGLCLPSMVTQEVSSVNTSQVSEVTWKCLALLFALLLFGCTGNTVLKGILDGQLMASAGRGDLATVAALLIIGANPSAETAFGITALKKAVDSRNVDVVKLLLECGADVNATTSDGSTI